MLYKTLFECSGGHGFVGGAPYDVYRHVIPLWRKAYHGVAHKGIVGVTFISVPASVPSERVIGASAAGPEASFNPLDRFAAIAWDYTATGHSTRGHPLAPLRRRLAARDLPSAGQVAAMEHGRQVSYAGLVICRQRPGTAAGVVFMTLEDETGFVNLVVWSKVFERFRSTILSASFLGVSGTIQSRHHVVHIIAARFWAMEWSVEPTAEPAARRNGTPPPGARHPLSLRSHDFH